MDEQVKDAFEDMTFREGMDELVQTGTAGLLRYYRFDDGGLSIEPHSSVWKGELGERGIDYTIGYMKQFLL